MKKIVSVLAIVLAFASTADAQYRGAGSGRGGGGGGFGNSFQRGPASRWVPASGADLVDSTAVAFSEPFFGGGGAFRQPFIGGFQSFSQPVFIRSAPRIVEVVEDEFGRRFLITR